MHQHGMAFLALLLAAALALVAAADAAANIAELAHLPWDEEGYLSYNVLLLPGTLRGSSVAAGLEALDHRTVVYASPDLLAGFSGARALCAWRSTPRSVLSASVVSFFGESGGLEQWVHSSCQRAEIGWINYTPDTVKLEWVPSDGRAAVMQQHIKVGERNTAWRTSVLGHRFRVSAPHMPEALEYEVVYDQINIVGVQPQMNAKGEAHAPSAATFQRTHENEMRRASKVRRTFTPVGFRKVKVPPALWGSIQVYYRNNRAHGGAVEEWQGKGNFVNWWAVDPEMIVPPFGKKRDWFKMFLPVVEEWIDEEVELQETDLYGIRRYNDGAELIKHVDREDTHALSAIINVDQIGMRQPWLLEIHDVDGGIHEVDMAPGDAVLYESAKCMHGRPKALQGESYLNVFFHYRPKDDPKWWKQEASHRTVHGSEPAATTREEL